MNEIRKGAAANLDAKCHQPTESMQDQDSRCSQRKDADEPILPIERPRTFRDTASALGVPYHVVQRAARKGLVPTYRLGSSRRYVKLNDFVELMKR